MDKTLQKGKLKIIGLPIGNIEDITLRALKELLSSKIILAEDTRNYQKLRSIFFNRFTNILNELETSLEKNQFLISYRDQNHDKVVNKILLLLEQGNDICLISDSGMPAISDPGFKLIRDVAKHGFEVEVFPGPTALISALVLSGLATDKFVFLGFLPRTEGKMVKNISKFIDTESTIIFYESPFRIKKTLETIKRNFGEDLEVSISSELTKKFEKTIRGSVDDVLKYLNSTTPKGEWAVCVRKL